MASAAIAPVAKIAIRRIHRQLSVNLFILTLLFFTIKKIKYFYLKQYGQFLSFLLQGSILENFCLKNPP
jgi:hypothetical protein